MEKARVGYAEDWNVNWVEGENAAVEAGWDVAIWAKAEGEVEEAEVVVVAEK